MKYLTYLLLCLLSPALHAQSVTFVAEDLAPFHFSNTNGKADGILVDLARLLFKESGLHGSIVLVPMARALEQTQNVPNTYMLSLLRTPERDPHYEWIGQSFEAQAYLVGLRDRDDLQLNDLDDAKKLKVGTIRGYSTEHYLKNAGFFTDENLLLSVNNEQLWGMLFHGRSDLVLTNFIGLEQEVRAAGFSPLKVKPYLHLPNFPGHLYIATGHHSNPEQMHKLTVALAMIKATGQYQALLDKWHISGMNKKGD